MVLYLALLLMFSTHAYAQQYTAQPGGNVPSQQPGGNYPSPGGILPTQQQPSGNYQAQQPGGNNPAQQPGGNYPSQQPSGNVPGQQQPGQQQPGYTSLQLNQGLVPGPALQQQGYGGNQVQPPPPGQGYGGGNYGGQQIGGGNYGNGGNQQQGCSTCNLQGGIQPGGTGGNYGGTGGNGGDTSDPCFTKYSNCIIVNAQPYERRPSVSLEACKSFCQNSRSNTSATYSCKSIVYDNNNRICDLFAHTGNQPPARLVQYSGRDYFEATGAPGAQCGGNVGPTGAPATSACPPGQDARFFKIPGSQFSGGGTGVTVSGVSEDQCVNNCASQQGQGGASAPCKAFNYNSAAQTCQLLPSGAPPKTGGVGSSSPLTPNAATNYYEEVCMDSSLVANCPRIMDRFPQKVLVGLAEVVSDSTSFSDCLMKCLNSQQLYKINCVSGEFYQTDNSQQNCILNIMTRKTRPDLFTDEDKDTVDYFEPGCTGAPSSSSAGSRLSIIKGNNVRVKGVSSLISKIEAENKLEAADSSPEELTVTDQRYGEWTQWSPCDRRADGRRVRYRRCPKPTLKQCPFEAERCQQELGKNFPSPPRFAFLRDEDSSVNNTYIGTTNCALDVCCPALGGCRVGLLRSSVDGKIQWCTEPCKQNKKV